MLLSTKQEYEKMESLVQKGQYPLKKLRQSAKREQLELSKIGISPKSTWLAIAEYGSKFAVQLNSRYKPIPTIDKLGRKSSGILTSQRHSQSNPQRKIK